ncbi:hypothetical protein V8F20_010668 [Naviculisporaceae sp. PSN 640]
MDLSPVYLGPTSPPDLLWFLIHSCVHPTTVIICSSRSDFLESLTQNLLSKTQLEPRREQKHGDDENQSDQDWYSLLSAAPLYQIAIARHLRIIFVPTVSHLRACLSVFSPDDSPVPPPPSTTSAGGTRLTNTGNLYGGSRGNPPLLIIYGFLDIHRYTSEWTVAGLSNTASVLLETAKRVDFKAVVTEPKREAQVKVENEIKVEEEEEQRMEADDKEQEKLPVVHSDPLSGSVAFINDGSVRIDLTGTGLGQRTVKVRQVLGRWFRFREVGLGEGTKL